MLPVSGRAAEAKAGIWRDCAIISLVYVSRSLIDLGERERVLDDIRAAATDRNSILGISGLLLASPCHFAQLIEGSSDAVDALMARIAADPRHTAIRVVRAGQIDQPRSPRWRMARYDTGNFGSSIIDPVLMAAHDNQARALGRLDGLIEAVLRAKQLG